MSYRREDPTLIEWLRRLQAEVDRLKRGDKGVRQNDIRLGDWVVNIDVNGCVNSKHIPTGNVVVTCPGDGVLHEIVWSYSGDILETITLDDAETVWYPPADVQLVELVVAVQQNFMVDPQYVEVELVTAGGTVTNIVLGETTLKETSTPGDGAWGPMTQTPVPTRLTSSDWISVKVTASTSVTALVNDLSVMLRYRYI